MADGLSRPVPMRVASHSDCYFTRLEGFGREYPSKSRNAACGPQRAGEIMADIKTCIVLDALDVSVLGEVEALSDFVVGATAHSITGGEVVSEAHLQGMVTSESLARFSGVPNWDVIVDAWAPVARALVSQITALAAEASATPDGERYMAYVDTSAVVTMMHHFPSLRLPVWNAIGGLVSARDPETTVLLALAQPGPLVDEQQYGRANSGGRWFVETTDEGSILRRCGLDRSRAIGYWGLALKMETYDVAEILSEPVPPKPAATEEPAPTAKATGSKPRKSPK